jgi:hypothetical protein
MTLSTWLTVPNMTDSTAFRLECTNIHNALAAVGLVQTSDTGQINLSTVNLPGATNTSAGYEIWKFNDSLQASYPCFIKIEYGTGNSGTAYFSFWFTIGTSTDGAGNLGSVKTTRTQLFSAGVSASSFTSGISGTPSRMTLVWCVASTSFTQWVTIERLQTTTGQDSNHGLCFMFVSRSGGVPLSNNQVIYYSTYSPTGTQPPIYWGATGWVIPYYKDSASGVFSNLTVGSCAYSGSVHPVGFSTHPPIHGALCYWYTDLSPYSKISISIYGNSATWLPLYTTVTPSGNTTTAILARWD